MQHADLDRPLVRRLGRIAPVASAPAASIPVASIQAAAPAIAARRPPRTTASIIGSPPLV